MAAQFPEILEASCKFVKEARILYPIEKAVLFGSYVKGTQREWSDIDIGLFLSSFGSENVLQIGTRLMRLGDSFLKWEWHTYFEPRVYRVTEIARGNPFVEEILRTGYELPVPDISE